MKYLKLMAILTLSIVVFITIGLPLGSVSATWHGQEPTLSVTQTNHACTEQIIEVGDANQVTETWNGCITYGLTIDIAYTYIHNETGADVQLGVRYKGDNIFVPLNLSGYIYLIPGTNKVIYDTPYYGVRSRSIRVVDDLSRALIPYRGRNEGPTYRYGIDDSKGRAIFHSIDKPSWYPDYYAVSLNGRYVVGRFSTKGFFKANIDTGVITKLFDFISTMPGWEGNEVIKAVSNDGRFVLLGNRGLLVDTTSCGNRIDNSANINTPLMPVGIPCNTKDISASIENSLSGGGFQYSVNRARFIDNGSSVEFDVRLYSYMLPDWRVLQVTNSQNSNPGIVFDDDPTLEYLALGDSFSSGEGDIGRKSDDSSYYLPGTNKGIDNCHISVRSYPYVLRDMWTIPDDTMHSVACSGARVVRDYMRYEDGYLGQGDRLASFDNVAMLQSEALQNFKPGHVQQIDFVKEYKPKIITLTGGGNDVGFARILEYCASPQGSDFIPFTNTTCGYAQSGSSLNKVLHRAIDAQYKPLKEFVDEVARASPSTRVILVGYPSIIAEYNGIACALNAGVLNIDEMRLINSATKRLNEVIKKVAQDTSADYVDIFDSLKGGRICEGSEHVTGVWSHTKGLAIIDEIFHPNASGHKKIAEAIDESGVYATRLAPISDYIVQPHTVTQQMPLYTNDAPIYRYGDQKPITTAPGTLLPNSPYDITSNSNPVHLGSFTTLSDGSANANVSFANVPVGRHVLVLEGIAPDGTLATYYQFIEVRHSTDDADGDGIKDVDDKCNFITHWYDETTGEDVCATTNEGAMDTLSRMLLIKSNPSSTVDPLTSTEQQYIVPSNTKSGSNKSTFFANEDVSKGISSERNEWPLLPLVVLITIAGIMGGIWLKKTKPNS
ncbi:MAG: SGNH/GDSL hydrolase family protein [Acidobacteriota bacterium]